MEQKKRMPFNAVDAVILALILLAAGFFVWRYAIRPGSPADSSTKTYPFVMRLDSTEIMDDLFEGKIAAGDTVTDVKTGAKLGVVTDIKTQPSRSYIGTDEGEWKLAPRPMFSWLTITIKGDGFRPSSGGVMVNGLQVFNNKTFEVNIGDSAFSLRVVEFTLEDSNG